MFNAILILIVLPILIVGLAVGMYYYSRKKDQQGL